VMPGLILSVAFVAYIIVRVQLTPSLAPRTPLTEYHGWSRLLPFVQYVVPLVSIFVIVVVSMSAGWATPTESAAIGAFATMLMAIVYRALTVKNLFAALRGTVAISTIILFIILGATTFAQILSFSGASNGLVGQLLGESHSGLLGHAFMTSRCHRACFTPIRGHDEQEASTEPAGREAGRGPGRV